MNQGGVTRLAATRLPWGRVAAGHRKVASAVLTSSVTLCTEVQRQGHLEGEFHIVRHRFFVASHQPALSFVRSH
jgi:hypothetical protein